MSKQLPSEMKREKEIVQTAAPFKECYKLYALMHVLLNRGIVRKEEIEVEYFKVASSMLQYFDDDDVKKEIMKFVL